MDTSWKNIKYSTGAKVAAFIIVWLCFLSAVGSALFLLYNESILRKQTYYDTYEFKNQFYSMVYDAVELNVKLKSEENIKASGDNLVVVQENIDRFHYLKNELSGTTNFAYYIKNTQTGEEITNISGENPLEVIKSQPVYFNRWTSDSGYSMQDNIKELLSGAPYEVYAAVTQPLKPGDVFYDDFTDYGKTKAITSYMMALLIASLIISISAFVYLVCVTGRREKGGEIVLLSIDRLYTDVHSLLVFIAAVISVSIALQIASRDPVALFIMALVFGIDVLIGLSYVLSMIRQIKNRQIFSNTLIYRLFQLFFNEKLFKAGTLLLLLAYGAINGLLFALAAQGDPGLFLISSFLIIAFNIAVIYFAARSLNSLGRIMEAAGEISRGNLDYALDGSQISVAFADLAGNIRSIQGGLKKAVAEAVRGERMKTDLITNVSHDLKTPLTSIINYVDLLKKEELHSRAGEYVSILEEKSARLKQLIEDLIEASKASSGNLPVRTEKVDLHELVLQAFGEYEEKIVSAGLDVRINDPGGKVFINADGKHLWRIVENLLSNVLKYSMPGSRVYINIEKGTLYGILVIKNISAFPLDISPDQLTERFVRADASRSTEGSGLGLSIAQGLANIQGGRFTIEIDGDLFKVIVEIPLWPEM